MSEEKAQIINLVMDILLSHENDLSDGFFYYLPLDRQAEAEADDMEPEDLQKMTLWRICQEIVDVVMGQL